MKKLILIIVFSLVFLMLMESSIAPPPAPPPAPPSLGSSENTVPGPDTIPETCSDGIENQDETDVDCGGICGPCTSTNEGNVLLNQEQDLKKESSDVVRKPDKEISTFFIFSLSLNLILVISFIIFLIFWFRKKPMLNKSQKPYFNNPQRTDPDVAKLKNYMTNYLNQGYNPEELKKILLLSDWPEQKLDEAFNEVKDGSRRAF